VLILFFSDISWQGLHQRPHHLARALARDHPVLWIEPATLIERPHWKPVRVEHNIFTISLPSLPYNARHRIVRALAKFLGWFSLTRYLMRIIQVFVLRRGLYALGKHESLAFLAHNFDIVHFIDTFKPVRVLYDYIDNIFGFGSLPSYLRPIWEETVRRADVVTVTSHVLERQIRTYRSNDVHYVGNGVEFDHFSKPSSTQAPPDLPQGKPIVGYVGAIYPWLDYDILEYIVRLMLEINFVLIGRVHPDVQRQLARFISLPNAHLLGFKPYREIPRYLSRFDVGIIPFQKNALTAAVNPVKFYEYCAAGVPTVATDFSEDLLQHEGIVFVVSSKEDFISAIDQARLKNYEVGFKQSLQMFARQHDWSTITSRMSELLYTR